MNTVEPITTRDIMNQRIGTYLLLARLYRLEVDAPFLTQLKALRFGKELGNQKIAEGYKLLQQYLSNTSDNTLIDLSIDYCRTFVGPGCDTNSAASPYESVYTSPDRMQEARNHVLEFFRAEGMSTGEGFKEPEDHLGLELEFMSYLCRKSMTAIDSGNMPGALSCLNKERKFLLEHLLNWVPKFADDVVKFSKEDLYRGLAKITVGLLELDSQTVVSLIFGAGLAVQNPASVAVV